MVIRRSPPRARVANSPHSLSSYGPSSNEDESNRRLNLDSAPRPSTGLRPHAVLLEASGSLIKSSSAMSQTRNPSTAGAPAKGTRAVEYVIIAVVIGVIVLAALFQ